MRLLREVQGDSTTISLVAVIIANRLLYLVARHYAMAGDCRIEEWPTLAGAVALFERHVRNEGLEATSPLRRRELVITERAA
jgi:hypothetical protein